METVGQNTKQVMEENDVLKQFMELEYSTLGEPPIFI